MQSSNENLIKIVELLNDGQYHDGTTLGSQLNITRAAVWKSLKKLESYGIPLESVKGRGYLLTNPLILLNPKKIKSRLKQHSIQLDIFEKINSTNDYLETLEKYGDQHKKIKICIAETQTKGKGRFNRRWYSPFAQNIYLSILYPFQKDVSELSGLSMVVALAICSAIESEFSLNDNALLIKWPNDIFMNSKKLAGTLIEIKAESNGFCQAIIGIGINVNMEKAPKGDIDQPWSSLLEASKNYLDRNILCSSLINTLIDYLETFASSGINTFLENWKKKDSLFNRSIMLTSGNNKYKGVCIGIDEKGHLQLKAPNNTIQTFSSGDTTLLK